MALEVGTRLGHYDVTALIGEGGMGQVYQATDTKLNRQVALKILPEAFATDRDRLARFQREAQVLASLNHPGIAAIYGIEEQDETRALVLELVEGPTLADRIGKGPIPVDEALPIAKQIAEAFEAAHEQGVIHRDLKPANIKVRDDGTVKVLDFGLAKALDPTPEGDPSQSPTLTAAATQMGVILGTAAYMSPEQARGKPVDKRADIWAFGVVLYEMLTGVRPFQGEDVSLTLTSVMKSDVNVRTLPHDVPAAIQTVLHRCLQKDPRRRVRDIGDVRLAMEGGFETMVSSPSETTAVPQLQIWQRPAPAAVGVLIVLVLGVIAGWGLFGGGSQSLSSPKRFTLTLPESDQQPRGLGDALALSPDGQTLVYRATRDGVFQLFRRPIDQFEATPIPGTENAVTPFFSPDGQWLGFDVQTDRGLRKVPLVGGPTQMLTPLPNGFRGADWGADDTIVFAVNTPGGSLMRVPAAGGEATVLFTPDDERRSWYPQLLADGDAVLFTLTEGLPDTGDLHLLLTETGEHRTLVPNAAAGRVLDTGHLIFVRSGALWAVPFDRDRLDIAGNPAPVTEGIRVEGGGAVQYVVADNGSLVYIPGAAGGAAARNLVWVERTGRQEPLATPMRDYRTLSLSQDGRRAAVSIMGESGNIDVWVSELPGQGRASRPGISFWNFTQLTVRPPWGAEADSSGLSSQGSTVVLSLRVANTPHHTGHSPG